ncbi:group III truncated hemoglobin [Helicobacter muridarum]|uniref:Group 3 truncated hemoglobin ctb n=1 Tax=Helicobacter muridarum TaxID=216 RepID=A0A099U0C6_9HELI|nr:group III truncated hemoglobin [Helicobacter muridarum]TLD98810.1 group III truncated hemoglobin [Helicobacter muridarum]STQ85788.1 Group 3 truncated hemoglobin ctb [Helicobacter muridarum]
MFQDINEDSIYKLMDIFYDKVKADKQGLGDVFIAKIGKDNAMWQEHKTKIASFWKGMLLGIGGYKGQPLKAHLELPTFPLELFSVWLGLFEESLREVYEQEEHVILILSRAKTIAKRFQYALSNFKHDIT